MRNLNRREFLRLVGATGVTVSLSDRLAPVFAEALSGPAGGRPPVVWLQGGSCSGCSVSLLNTVKPDIAEVLTGIISLEFHQTLMAAVGDHAMDTLERVRKQYAGQYYLVVEGSIPVGAGGRYCTLGEQNGKPMMFTDIVKRMGADARGIIAAGTCATYGGIPAGKSNPTEAKSVSDILPGKAVINVPGCPIHPDRLLGTLVHLIKYGVPALDSLKRPTMFFGKCVHDLCGRRELFDKGVFATTYSERGCLYKLGCKGPMAYNDCPKRRYNNAVSWCVGANSPCLACVEPGFPDLSSPFYVRQYEYGPVGTPTPQPAGTRVIGGNI